MNRVLQNLIERLRGERDLADMSDARRQHEQALARAREVLAEVRRVEALTERRAR
jgi:hypothetical protein